MEIEERPPESIEIGVYYAVSEALTNAVKHSGASRISVSVRVTEGVLQVTVADDGRGGAETSGGSGLIGLIDRVGLSAAGSASRARRDAVPGSRSSLRCRSMGRRVCPTEAA